MGDFGGTGFTIELPGGGTFPALSQDEVDLAAHVEKSYVDEFNISKSADLGHIAAIIVQRILIHRAHLELSGFEPVLDALGKPTGELKRSEKKRSAKDLSDLQKTVNEAQKEIRSIEKSLGVDKATREKGGADTVADYIRNVKAAARAKGIRLNERLVAYDDLFNQIDVKTRLLENADDEDLRLEDLSPEKFIRWLRSEVVQIQKAEQDWCKDKFAVYVGKM